jgi:hypothetical protein
MKIPAELPCLLLLIMILLLIRFGAAQKDQEQDQDQEQEFGGKALFFRRPLKLAKEKPFPAFFASLCPRLAQWPEREPEGWFLWSRFW